MDYKIFSSNISRIFRATRHFYGLSQHELARKLGMNRTTVSKIETGSVAVSFVNWIKFVETFKITDPSCFTNGKFEFQLEVYEIIFRKGSLLAPKFKFDKKNSQARVRDVVEKLNVKKLKKVLEKEGISEDLFLILNHPLCDEIIKILPFK